MFKSHHAESACFFYSFDSAWSMNDIFFKMSALPSVSFYQEPLHFLLCFVFSTNFLFKEKQEQIKSYLIDFYIKQIIKYFEYKRKSMWNKIVNEHKIVNE